MENSPGLHVWAAAGCEGLGSKDDREQHEVGTKGRP